MSTLRYFHLPSISLLDVTGRDAMRIVHNLTTNDVASLDDQGGRESFVTDVKGKTIGHIFVFRDGASLRLIGPAGQSERIAAHVDRYTIVEDVQVAIADDQWSVFVLPPESIARVIPALECRHGCLGSWELTDFKAKGYEVPWLGPGTMVLLSATSTVQLLRDHLLGLELTESDERSFQLARTAAGFPWVGIDFDDKSLPQEVDRNAQAISFTKGCYLGQETVARLDAMGQVQKKLVRWRLQGEIPGPPRELVSAGKTVGRLTSIAPTSDHEAMAIGIARRSHFDAGAQASGTWEGGAFTAVVL